MAYGIAVASVRRANSLALHVAKIAKLLLEHLKSRIVVCPIGRKEPDAPDFAMLLSKGAKRHIK
jgi:hypothetical protein